MSERDDADADAGAEQGDDPAAFERILGNDLESLASTNAALAELLARHAVSAETSYACTLVLEEIVTNIVKYAHADGLPHAIRFGARCTPGHVVLRFSDDGREFNPLAEPAPDLNRPPEERAVGGLGIHLVRRFAERVEYERVCGQNTLTVFVANRT